MTNDYDGPSFSRLDHEKKDVHTGYETKSGDFLNTFVPPVMKKEAFKKKTNFRMIEKLLSKRPDEYYLVVSDDEPLSENTVDSELETIKVKEIVKRDNKHALGHSLSDILETENQAQKQLKIFNNN